MNQSKKRAHRTTASVSQAGYVWTLGDLVALFVDFSADECLPNLLRTSKAVKAYCSGSKLEERRLRGLYIGLANAFWLLDRMSLFETYMAHYCAQVYLVGY